MVNLFVTIFFIWHSFARSKPISRGLVKGSFGKSHQNAGLAQLAARQSHNLKVVSSILTQGKVLGTEPQANLNSRKNSEFAGVGLPKQRF